MENKMFINNCDCEEVFELVDGVMYSKNHQCDKCGIIYEDGCGHHVNVKNMQTLSSN